MDENIIVNVKQRSQDRIITFSIRNDFDLEAQRSEIQRKINIHFNILKTALHGQNVDLTKKYQNHKQVQH